MGESRTLGDYRLIKQIGQGSMGPTFVAEQRFTKKTYVVKILPEELALDRSFLQRFDEDISILSSFDHPNIAKVYTVGFAQGVYFIVSDCIVDAMGEITNLGQYFAEHKKKLSAQEILFIAKQIASAIDYGHSIKDSAGKPFAHRALKLNNILIGAKTADGPTVYVTDWGLSRIIGTSAALTRTFKGMAEALGVKIQGDSYPQPSIDTQKLLPLHASLLQNFAFLAPEQKRIDRQSDERIDSYAFGVLVYYLLTGEYPEGAFALPSALTDAKLVDWDSVVTHCLQPYPLLRAASLLELFQKTAKLEMPKEVYKQEELPIMPAAVETEVRASAHLLVEKEKRTPWVREERRIMEYAPEKREHADASPILTDMVTVQGGSYLRGSNTGCRDEMPQHRVDVASFAVDIHPVTNEQFVRFLEAMNGEKDAQNHDIIRLRDSRIKKSGGRISVEPGYNKHPVVGVTWYGAVAYCQWVGKRLPTEVEWEVACCGGLDNPLYSTGDQIEKTQANFFSSDTTAVMSYPPNGYGLYDMSGNVYEWCQDWYEYAYYEASQQEPNNPKGPLQGVYRVLRGGCWKSLKEDLRAPKRHRNNPGSANGTYGFRCVSDA
jgi:formylglycine-generating enzyme required for sulfatase activity